MKCVENAIAWIVKNWDKVPDVGHPNPGDLLVVAHVIQTKCQTKLADFSLEVETSRHLLNLVGDYMFDPVRVRARGGELLIRRRPIIQLREEMQTVGEMISELAMNIGYEEVALLKALFLVASFDTMSRVTSDAFGESEDTDDRRLETYNMLTQISTKNSWARAGVILTRLVRPNIPMVENWIPASSLYWEDLITNNNVEV